MKTSILRAILPGVLLLALAGCSRTVDATPSPSSSTASPAASTARPTVARIAFVDQEEACECTRKRINESWAALQAAMKQSREVPVQRIHRDTQPVDVAPLSAKRAFIAVPAIFLLDGSGEVIDMLQGEVTDKELIPALR
ncbi:MAG: hypothetical protein HY898_11290 [Deltaproteobacteria bacterium]|nr:hypothetical protein [Deltaproteobacteria bacterium]